MESYNNENYVDATTYFERSVKEFYEAEELCRSSCEMHYVYDDEERSEDHKKHFQQQIIGKRIC